MFTGRIVRVRNWAIAAGVLVLAATALTVFVASGPAAAYDSSATWALADGAATSTSPSGLVTTVTRTGDVALSGHQSFASTNAPASSEYDPNISMQTDALRWSAGAGCFADGTCVPTGTNQVGTITVTFSEPVRNPALHFEGIGAITGTAATGNTVFSSTYTLVSATSDGATLGAVSSGASDLTVANGDTITTGSPLPNTACDSVAAPAESTAGCGTVHVNGTVTQLTFDVGIKLTQIRTTGLNTTSGDAVGLAVSFDQNSSTAPASYDQGAVTEHDNGDLALGTAIGPGGNALSSWPSLTTAMIGAKYSVRVPISGASRAGVVCGYLDFAHTGNFSAGEDAACSAFAAGDRAVTLAWTVPADLTAGITYARLRAAYDATQAESPTGLASSGEVEDYQVSILPTVTIKTNLPSTTVGTFDRSVNNTVLGGSSTVSAGTVGPSGTGLAKPDVAVPGDIRTAPLALTVSEAPTAGNSFGYAAAVTCVDGLGGVLTQGTSLVQSVSIPQSGKANGAAQNITCTFDTTGVASLALSASASQSASTSVGQSVGYSALVTNTGNAAVTNLTVIDALSKGSLPITCAATSLAPNATTTCIGSPYTATQADVDKGKVVDTATATANAGATTVNSGPSAPAETVINAPSGLSVQLTGRVNGGATVGDIVRWNVVVTNSGLTTVHDLSLSTPTGVAGTCPQTALAPSASVTCSLPAHTVTETESNTGQVTASLVAAGHSVSGPVASTRAVAAVAVASPIPLTGVSELGPTLGRGSGRDARRHRVPADRRPRTQWPARARAGPHDAARLAVAVAALAIIGGLTACTTAKHRSEPAPSSSSSPIPIPTEPAPAQPTSLPTYVQYSVPASVANDADKHKQVQVTGCSSSGSGASATGTVHNTGTQVGQLRHHRVLHQRHRDRGELRDDVGHGRRRPAGRLHRAAHFAAPDKVLCVLVGVS